MSIKFYQMVFDELLRNEIIIIIIMIIITIIIMIICVLAYRSSF